MRSAAAALHDQWWPTGATVVAAHDIECYTIDFLAGWHKSSRCHRAVHYRVPGDKQARGLHDPILDLLLASGQNLTVFAPLCLGPHALNPGPGAWCACCVLVLSDVVSDPLIPRFRLQLSTFVVCMFVGVAVSVCSDRWPRLVRNGIVCLALDYVCATVCCVIAQRSGTHLDVSTKT